MGIRYVTGDILSPITSEYPVVVCHQVNCKGVMGAGLAKQVRDRFPEVYEVYKGKCEAIAGGVGGLGDIQYCSVLSEAGYIIANVFGQDGYGRTGNCYTDYAALQRAFNKLAQAAEGRVGTIVRIPYNMGCGLGGGDWFVVSKIIQETLVDKGVNVEIWSNNVINHGKEPKRSTNQK